MPPTRRPRRRRFPPQANRIAFAALVGGLATLAAAVAAAVFARHAAVAARGALVHSRDVAALELRPYLDFAGVKVRRTADRPEVVVNIENFGRVPATVTAMETGYALVGKTGRFPLPKLRDSRFDPRSVAPGGSIESVHRSLLRPRNLAALGDDEGRVVFHCRIAYTDFARSFEDVLERAWMIRRDHLDGERTLMRVHRTRYVLAEDAA